MIRKTLIGGAAVAALSITGAAFAQSPSGSGAQSPSPRSASPGATDSGSGAAPSLQNNRNQGATGGERAQERTGTNGSGATTTTQSKPGASETGSSEMTTGQVPKVQISDQQRTQLRSRIKDANIRTVDRDQINVSISVGAVLPSTVTFVPLPDQIVTIVPEFRGYQAVQVGDQILIVEPGTRRIVYIIEA